MEGRRPNVSEEVEPVLSLHGVRAVQKDAVGTEDLKEGGVQPMGTAGAKAQR